MAVLTWRLMSPMRPSAASWLSVGNIATAMLTPITPTGICESWNA